ncbi:hypothetical protein ACIRRA_26875 [Nocardia sp. NPDC101769]|uniref:hypothetical protein n=1 Tax=Nocardia sp. NPDC101769 TaxID=3364333 RepID=UPI0037FD9E25
MNNPTGSSAHQVLDEILTRYGSLDAFIAHLHAVLDAPPTIVLPIPVVAPAAGGRHRLRDPADRGPSSRVA